MSERGFSRDQFKGEVAKGNMSIDVDSKKKSSEATIKALLAYQFKINSIQYISAGLMLIAGIIISFVNQNGIAVTIGSLVQGDTTVSNITVNLGALLILGGLYTLLIIVKNSNTDFKQSKHN